MLLAGSQSGPSSRQKVTCGSCDVLPKLGGRTQLSKGSHLGGLPEGPVFSVCNVTRISASATVAKFPSPTDRSRPSSPQKAASVPVTLWDRLCCLSMLWPFCKIHGNTPCSKERFTTSLGSKTEPACLRMLDGHRTLASPDLLLQTPLCWHLDPRGEGYQGREALYTPLSDPLL